VKDHAVRNGHPLNPIAEPKVGDTLWIMGCPMKLAEIVSAGGREPDSFRVFRFKDMRYPDNNQFVDIPSRKGGEARASSPRPVNPNPERRPDGEQPRHRNAASHRRRQEAANEGRPTGRDASQARRRAARR
jgi:hypothetical protein